MTDLFDKLYSQFLSGKTNRKDFEGFKESLNHPFGPRTGRKDGSVLG